MIPIDDLSHELRRNPSARESKSNPEWAGKRPPRFDSS